MMGRDPKVPNMQNIPVPLPPGQRSLRDAFAGHPMVLLSANYSQIEMRLLAAGCPMPTDAPPMSDERLRQLQWAAEYVGNNPPRQGCRCADECRYCRELARHRALVGPVTMMELIREVRRLREAGAR